MTPAEIKRLYGIDVQTSRDGQDTSSNFDNAVCNDTTVSCDIFQEIENATLKEDVIEKTAIQCNWIEQYIEPAEIKTPVKCTPTIPGTLPGDNIVNNITIINKASNYILVDFSKTENSTFIGTTSYQNDVLKDADVIEYIIINNTIETKAKGDFTFDSASGTLSRSPNTFTISDVLIINYNK